MQINCKKTDILDCTYYYWDDLIDLNDLDFIYFSKVRYNIRIYLFVIPNIQCYLVQKLCIFFFTKWMNSLKIMMDGWM